MIAVVEQQSGLLLETEAHVMKPFVTEVAASRSQASLLKARSKLRIDLVMNE